MKIRTEPLLGATAFAFILLLISNLVSTFITYSNMNNMLNMIMSPNFDPFANQTPLVSSVAALVSCLVIPTAGLGSGIVYAILHNREEPLTASPAKGGAAAGALGFFLSGLVSAVLAGLMVFPLMNRMNEIMFMEMGGMDPAMTGLPTAFTGFGVVGAVIGGLCGGLIFAVLGAILGALGGVLGKSFAKPKPAT